jgi:hypothetical protein
MKEILLLFVCFHYLNSIQAATYYSQCSCSPNTLANWNTNRTGGGSSPTNFITTGDIFVVQNGHSMTTTATITFTLGASGKLQIESGGTLQGDHQILITNSTTTFQIDNWGTYIQNNTSSMSSGIFGGIESFASNSNFTIKLSPNPFTSNIPFGNLTLDYTTLTTDIADIPMTINGKLKIASTGTAAFVIGNATTARALTVASLEITGGKLYVAGGTSTQNANAVMSLTVTGDATISGGELQIARTNLAGTYSANIGGNLTLSGGNIYCMNNSGTGGIIAALNVTGNVNISGGELDINRNGATNAGRLFVKGNFTQSGGNLRMSSTASSGSSGIYFEGTGTQTLTFSGGIQTSTTNILNRFYYKTSAGPTELNEIYSSTTSQNTITGSTGNPASAGSFAAWPTSGTLVKNVIFNNSAGVTLSNTRTINTALQLLSGTLNNNATNNLTMASGSTIEKTNGSLSAAPVFAGTVNLLYSENASSITNTGNEVPTSPSVLNNITLDNTKHVNLNSNMSVNGIFTFTKGAMKCAGSNVLTFNAGSSHSGAGGQSYVIGKVSKIGNTAFTFPIGSDLLFRSASISAPSNSTDKFSAQYFRSNPTSLFGTGKDVTLNNVSKLEYWDVSRDIGTSSVSVSLDWESSTSGVTNPSDLRVSHWKSNSSIWEDLGKTNSITASSTSGFVTSNVTSNFSPFTLGSATAINPLPIELYDFDIFCYNNKLKFFWETKSEDNNHFYSILSSSDAINWSVIDTIKSKGNTSIGHQYEFLLDKKIDGKYFRLKQTDYDQKFELFPIKYFDSEMCLNYDHFIYYNQDKRTIIWNLVSDNYYFELIDYTGRVYLSGVTDLNYINTDKLNDGVYIFKLKVNGVHYIKKIVIKKL